MNKEPNNLGKKAGRGRWYLLLWLGLAVTTFLILLIVMLFSAGGTRSFSDWLAPALFLFMNSLLIATAIIGVWLVACWSSCWRNLRWLLFAGGCLVGLVVLFYAEEDLRGWLTWTWFKHACEARGEHFNLASVVPPPVPD